MWIDVTKVCRTCLKENTGPMKSIYTTITIDVIATNNLSEVDGVIGNESDNQHSTVELTVLDLIESCSSIASADIFGLPTQICEKCIKDLQASYIFKLQCENAFKRIESFLYASDKSQLDSDICVISTIDGQLQNDKTTDALSLIETDGKQTEATTSQETAHTCAICSKKFVRLTQLRYHTHTVHMTDKKTLKVAVHKCNICDMGFVKPAGLKKHIERMHSSPPLEKTIEPPVPIYCCEFCSRTFNTEEDYQQHDNCDFDVFRKTNVGKSDTPSKEDNEVEKEVDQLPMSEMDSLELPDGAIVLVPTKMTLPEILDDDNRDDDFDYEPDNEEEIENVFGQSETVEKTLRRKIDKRGRPQKNKTTNERIVTDQTASKHNDQHQCSECDKTFTRATHLKRHLTTHSEERPFACNMCDKKFRRADHLRIHQHHHASVKPHTCEHCQKGFTRSEHLRRHILARHTGRLPPKKEFICDICKRGFTTSKYLQVHIKSHTERTFDCKFCDEKFDSKPELTEHAKCHANEKPYLCSECGLRFVRNDYLVVHMRRHKGEKPYKCKYCNKGFPRATDLTVHERYHTGEKTHLCTTCGKGFQRAYNLLVHMRVHTGERPYQCPHCVKKFAQGNDLKAHVRRHTGERYKCDICGAGFIQGYHLTSHKRTVHGIDMKSHIRRVAKIPPNNSSQQISSDEQPTIAPSSINKPKVFQVLSNADCQLFNAHHESMEMQHQLLGPMTIADGQNIVIDPQQTIVMLHMSNDIDIKMEPNLNQISHNSQSVDLYQTSTHDQTFQQMQQ